VAPLAAAAFVTTLVFIAGLGYFAVRTALPLINGGFPDSFDLLASLVLALIIAYAWLRSVKGYSLAERDVIIIRAGPGKVHIPTDSIKSIEVQPELGSFIKPGLLSIQGLFGWAGDVNVRKPTDVSAIRAQAYGTNPANMVVLRLNDGRVMILTPSDTAGFAEALHETQNVGTLERSNVPTSSQGKKKRSRGQ
jgi:hypothetical protein